MTIELDFEDIEKKFDLSQVKSIPGFPNFYDFNRGEAALPPYGSDELEALEESETVMHFRRLKRMGDIKKSFDSSSYDLRCGSCGHCESLGEKKSKAMVDYLAQDMQKLVDGLKMKPESAFKAAFTHMFEDFCHKLKKGYPSYEQAVDQLAWAEEDLEGISGAPLKRILDYKKDVELGVTDCDNKRNPDYQMVSKRVHNFLSELSSAIDSVNEMQSRFFAFQSTPELSRYIKDTFWKRGFRQFRDLRNNILHGRHEFGLHTEYNGGHSTIFFDFDDEDVWKQKDLFEHLLGFYKHVCDDTIRIIEYLVTK